MIRAVGLMSGTSLDGIDAALVRLRPHARGYAIELERFATTPFPDALRARIVAALPPNEPAPRVVAALDAELGRAFGDAAVAIAREEPIDFVASHGLTLYHDGDAPVTMQIGDPFAIRERTGVTVVADFRRADVAAGGHGAPLVPFVDALLFADETRDVAALNLGGIANVTLVPAARSAPPRAWDTGPGNLLLDAFVRARTRGTEGCDVDGAYGERGTVDGAALRALVDGDDYLRLPPPKSTGRERYGDAFLERRAGALARLSLADGCATLAAFTAHAVADALDAHAPSARIVVASGGGTHNARLMRELASALGTARPLVSSATFGVDPDAKEAVAFAVLGCEALRGRAAGLPSVTGACRPTVLGAIVPVALDSLLERIDAGVRGGR